MTDVAKIVGIGGLPRSGKDALAEVFINSGYYGVSFGDITREYARKRHKDKSDPISVANMTETSNWMREKWGPDVILKEAMKRFNDAQKNKSYRGVVLFSVRAPVEADFIRAHGGELIWVEASDQIRHRRWMENLREGEAKVTLAEMKRQEDLQWQPQPGISAESQMNVGYIKQHATRSFVNNGKDLDEFNARAKKLIDEIGK